jgi:Tfp pilus assembly protein PilF
MNQLNPIRMKQFIFQGLAGLFLLASCTQNDEPIVDQNYKSFLNAENLKASQEELANTHAFWQNKLESSPENVVYLQQMASILSQRFDMFHDLASLDKSDSILEALHARYPQNVSVLHALSHNAITRHQFNAALDYAEAAFSIGEKKDLTQLLLVDIYLEKGRLTEAEDLLNSLGSPSRFDRQIRWVKIHDQKGDLDLAVATMEDALANARASSDKGLMLWAYSNLGDMYGHQGRINDSYSSYLKALSIDPSDSHSLKGIGWIAYSHDQNLEVAEEIWAYLDSQSGSPDVDLLLSDLYALKGDGLSAEKHLQDFIRQVNRPAYGNMYGAYLVDRLEDSDSEEALFYAQQDLEQREHPMTYAHLALAEHQEGNTAKAIYLLKSKVLGMTEEPMAFYIAGQVFQEAGDLNRAEELLSEALSAGYELGPLKSKEIQQRLRNI